MTIHTSIMKRYISIELYYSFKIILFELTLFFSLIFAPLSIKSWIIFECPNEAAKDKGVFPSIWRLTLRFIDWTVSKSPEVIACFEKKVNKKEIYFIYLFPF